MSSSWSMPSLPGPWHETVMVVDFLTSSDEVLVAESEMPKSPVRPLTSGIPRFSPPVKDESTDTVVPAN